MLQVIIGLVDERAQHEAECDALAKTKTRPTVLAPPWGRAEKPHLSRCDGVHDVNPALVDQACHGPGLGDDRERHEQLGAFDPFGCPAWPTEWQRASHLARRHLEPGCELPTESGDVVPQGEGLGQWTRQRYPLFCGEYYSAPV
ncbi:hypothetical protein QF035_002351 [Streptomyces umbrinus]|uniref:Uncharacterized protein n=1 Tax=Streptomyces umbrinus TaxID=67370 RepID=A0ABU0SMI0_9ACTN|nr:hypothetical protein [Streptomyces umbrinus]MDQ1024769.1 hypothetical protein [Streptomyces umbrinus]